MDAINPTLVLVFLSAVAVIYAAWMMYFTMRESRRTNEERGNRGNAYPSEDKKGKRDIMGKSLFVLEQGVSPPQAAVHAEPEPDTKKSDTFAPENVPQHPRQIAPEELDEVFGEAPEGESNEPLDIDQPLYVEPPFPEEEADDGDDEDENEELPIRGRHSAQGDSYENLGEAYRRVVHNPSLTNKEEEETGRILLDLKQTDMFEAIVSGSPTGQDRATYLMDFYLAAFNKRMSERTAESPTPPSTVAPPGFNLRDYV